MYRNLTKDEISDLVKQGCFSDNWQNISVKDGFAVEYLHQVRFSEKIRLGKNAKDIGDKTINSKSLGIYNSNIQNCTIGDDVLISDVHRLSNYEIEDGAIIENIGTLITYGESSFGQGTEIEILNEAGGRELPIFDRLTAQMAYLLVMYRHDEILIKNLRTLVKRYVQTKISSIGKIDKNAVITNCQSIKNVNVGEFSALAGVQYLENGTIVSCKDAPVTIGSAVIAKNFIIHSGSKIDSGVILANCFVGQGVQMGKQFSGENSAFFANCEAFHGEACSIFAGPYTVTHHKSTLLIAGMFSFYNAGSASNQSNHMYKLGPLHQGILERGSKTGSSSYLLWPGHIGAYSVVIGKHYLNFDTSDLPFSYISEEDGKSKLTPGFNLFTVGTRRDSLKFPNRNRRKDPDQLDLINFELFNPFIIGKILRGTELMKNLYDKASKDQEFVTYKGISILRLMLKTAVRYYDMAIKIYIGNEFLKQIKGAGSDLNLKEILNQLKYKKDGHSAKWIDLSGMITSSDALENLMDAVKSEEIRTVDELSNGFKLIFSGYDTRNWAYCAELIKKIYEFDVQCATSVQLIQIINDWKANSIRLNNMILKDAEKEFDQTSKIGFGIDGDESVRNKDFEAVRGIYEENKFVKELKQESLEIEKKANELIIIFEKC